MCKAAAGVLQGGDFNKNEVVVTIQCDVIMLAPAMRPCVHHCGTGTGRSVLVLEKAPEYFAAAYLFHRRHHPVCYNASQTLKKLIPDMSPEEEALGGRRQYTEDQFYDDLMRVPTAWPIRNWPSFSSQTHSNAKMVAGAGVRFVLAFGRQAFKREDKYYFWGGLLVEAVGLVGLSDQQFAVAERLGVEICYARKGYAAARPSRAV